MSTNNDAPHCLACGGNLLATTSDMEKRHMDMPDREMFPVPPAPAPAPVPSGPVPSPVPSGHGLVYGVWRRDDLVAIYDNETSAVEHASTIEAKEHATVSVDLWKVRKNFDVASFHKAHAMKKLDQADQKILGLDLANMAKTVLEKGTRIYASMSGPRAGKEYINRE